MQIAHSIRLCIHLNLTIVAIETIITSGCSVQTCFLSTLFFLGEICRRDFEQQLDR